MSGDTIGRADYELRARVDALKRDLAEAEAEVGASGVRTERAYTAQSSKWGAAIASGVRAGVKAVSIATAGMLGIAAAGAAQLEGIQARYQAETGASAEEARRTGRVINQVAGENRLSLESVADAAVKVHNDLGLSGDAADKATALFAKFARVTGQDVGGAVTAFDDILDSWNLTADDTNAVMGALIVKHQRYGGVITDDQRALAALASPLRAANMGWQDGVALLGLASASGLNAADATGAMTHALAKVKSPEELRKLVDDISATEDPFLRAQLAADLFGIKAGPKMANALAGNHLDDFRISVHDTTDAVNKGGDALDSTFGAKIQLMLSEFGASLRGLGADFGPFLTGLASAGLLLKSLGLTDLLINVVSKAWVAVAASPAITAARAAGVAAGQSYGAGMVSGLLGVISGIVVFASIADAIRDQFKIGAGQHFGESLDDYIRRTGSTAQPAAEQVGTTTGRTIVGFMGRTIAEAPVPEPWGGKEIFAHTVAEAGAAATSINGATARIWQSFASLTSRLLGQFDADYTRAMDISDARIAISADNVEKANLRKQIASGTLTTQEKADAKARIVAIDEEEAKRYEDLAKLGELSTTDAAAWDKTLLELVNSTTGSIKTAWEAALAAERGYVSESAKLIVTGGVFRYEPVVGRASGGATDAGRTYLVGEHGPELWSEGRSGWMTPNSQLGRLAGLLGSGIGRGAAELEDLLGSPSIASAAMRAVGSSTTNVTHVTNVTNLGGITLHGVGSDVSPAAAVRFGRQVMEALGPDLRQQTARMAVDPR